MSCWTKEELENMLEDVVITRWDGMICGSIEDMMFRLEAVKGD